MSDEHFKAASDPLPSGMGDPLVRRDAIMNNGQPAPGPRSGPITGNLPSSPAGDPKDGVREIVETVVFVVVLVLMLKTFIAEAFVIPTGSMATTLYGYHREVTCPQCDFKFPVNISKQVEGDALGNRDDMVVTRCTCPNCFLRIQFGPDAEGDHP